MVAPINPIFTWQDGKLRSPQEVSREREIAEALMFAKPQATGPFGALGQIGSALSGSLLDSRADAYTEQGREAASNLFAGIGSGSSADAISAALLNPAAEWATPAQSGIAEALFNNEIRQSDPAYQLGLQQDRLNLQMAQAEYDAMMNPSPQLYDPNAPEAYQLWQLQQANPGFVVPEDGPLVQVNTGETNDFYKALDADAGKQIPVAIEAGRVAQSNNVRLSQLETLLGPEGTAPQGAQGALVQLAGQLGIPLDGASDIQAAQAIINQMVPGQRPPGSGTMSDADLALFKASLPAIINQPNGNQKIIETTKRINEYVIEQAKIAEALANRQITREEAAQLQAAVPNPLSPETMQTQTAPDASVDDILKQYGL